MRSSRLAAIKLAIAAGLVLVACGPEPGTPEYVLSKLREGRVVGGKNLKLLSEAELGEMTALLEDREAPSIARLQVLERIFQLELDDSFERLSPYIDDPDPELRLRVIRWLSTRQEPESARLLMARLQTEQEIAVRVNVLEALSLIGRGIGKPDPELIAEMLAHLEHPDAEHRHTWIRVLGSWHGENVEAALIRALDDPHPKVRAAAARALNGPAIRSLARVAPLLVSMLTNGQPEVRSAGIEGLTACTRTNRMMLQGGSCVKEPLLALLEVVPELPEALASFRQRSDLTTKDQRLAKELAECIRQHTGVDAGAAEPTATGG